MTLGKSLVIAIRLGCQNADAKPLVIPQRGRMMWCRFATFTLTLQTRLDFIAFGFTGQPLHQREREIHSRTGAA